MNRRIQCILAFSIAAFYIGCEDVILLDLNETEPKIVIEGNFEGPGSNSFFRISRTSNFYEYGFELVSGARVLVGDTLLKTFATETSAGYYQFRFPGPIVGKTYEARVTIDGVTYAARSVAPPPIEIDSLSTVVRAPTGLFGDTLNGKTIIVHFQDQPGVENFAQIATTSRGFLDSRNLYMYLYDGKYSDGRNIDYSMQYTIYSQRSHLGIMIRAMDAELFEYFRELKENIAYNELNGNGVRDVAPTNPNSNWDNGALGYFGVFQVYSDTITVIVP